MKVLTDCTKIPRNSLRGARQNSIYDDNETAGFGAVAFDPFSESGNPCAPVPDLPAAVLFASGLVLAAVCLVFEKRRGKRKVEEDHNALQTS